MSNATIAPTDLSSMTAPIPPAPVSVEDTGIPADRLTQLLMKTLYVGEATGTALTLVSPEELRALHALQRSFGLEMQG